MPLLDPGGNVLRVLLEETLLLPVLELVLLVESSLNEFPEGVEVYLQLVELLVLRGLNLEELFTEIELLYFLESFI